MLSRNASLPVEFVMGYALPVPNSPFILADFGKEDGFVFYPVFCVDNNMPLCNIAYGC